MMKIVIYQDDLDSDGQKQANAIHEDIMLDVITDQYDVPVRIVYGPLPLLEQFGE